MEFSFTSDQELLRKSAREVLAERSTSQAVRKAMGSKTGTDESLWSTVRELGWAGVGIDESLGGLGLGLIEECILAEEIGRTVAPIPFFSTVGLATQIVEQLDPSPARDAFLRRVAAGESRATLAHEGRVKATQSDQGWTISGTATNVPEAHLADEIVVVATVGTGRERSTAVFVVPASALKSKPKPKESLDQTRRLADVRLGGVSVGADALLAQDAAGALARGLDRAAVVLAAEAVGVAQSVLDMAVGYAKEREQFGKKIGSFQAISHRCANMFLLTENARSHTYYAAWALEEGTPDAALAAASAKAAAADAAREVANDGIQVHGGIGFTWEHDMHLFYRRAKFCELYLGDASQWRERVASLLVS